MDTDSFTQTASCKNLRRLFWLRGVMVAGLCAVVAGASFMLDLQLPLEPVVMVLGLLVLLNFATWLRLRHARQIGDHELLAQLLVDMALLSMLFYHTGGYTNPFVWMYLLPLTIAAVALPWAYTWGMAGLAVGSYTLLMFAYVPLPLQHHHHGGSDFSLHLLGMWFGFVASAGIIAYFVARIGKNLRDHDHLMAEVRERALESERMLALGTLAAAAAHELGTPLATMAVLAKELETDCAKQPDQAKKLALMRQQIDRCKDILNSIAASAGQGRAESIQAQALDDFLDATITRWHETRPATRLDCTLAGDDPAPVIAIDRTLGQALVNLFDNAADASPEHVEIGGGWHGGELLLTIRDHGPGLSPQVATQAGTPFFSTKQDQGLGLGLYLARAIIERFGGTLELVNHPQGGGMASMRLPLDALTIREAS